LATSRTFSRGGGVGFGEIFWFVIICLVLSDWVKG
jgi:hypothetical protein